MLDPRNHTYPELLALSAQHGLSEKQTRRWLAAVLGKGLCESADWLAVGLLQKSSELVKEPLPRLQLVEVRSSPKDQFQKYLYRAADGLLLESVAIPLHKPGCVSICLSSQIGCAMACTFCATARMPQRRNLETWEIVDQYLQTRAAVVAGGRRVTGAVFMGMGEPFLNYKHVMASAELLSLPLLNAIGSRAITVSTVGLVPQIERFTDEQRPFRLSISLGAASDQKRAQLVPVAAKTPVALVMAAARRHALARKERIMLAYVCVSGINVGEEDARALAELIGDTPVRLDLIEVTDTSGRYQAPSESELNAFRDALRKHLGQPVVRRYSGGKEISAACGTLAGQALEV